MDSAAPIKAAIEFDQHEPIVQRAKVVWPFDDLQRVVGRLVEKLALVRT